MIKLYNYPLISPFDIFCQQKEKTDLQLVTQSSTDKTSSYPCHTTGYRI